MKKTLIFAAIFALLAMIYVPGAMHTYRGSNVAADTASFLTEIIPALLSSSYWSTSYSLRAWERYWLQVPKRFLIIGGAVVVVYAGITSFIAIRENDNANDLFAQRKYGEAAQAYHQAAIWWRAGLRFDQAHEDDTACSRAEHEFAWENFPAVKQH
jgi:hypothetical protein